MSFNFPNFFYWLVISTSITCFAAPGGNVTDSIKTDAVKANPTATSAPGGNVTDSIKTDAVKAKPTTTSAPGTSSPTTHTQTSSDRNATKTPVSKLEKVLLKQKNVSSKSITVEWQREVELKESDKFNLTIELKIEGGDSQPIQVNSSAGSPGIYTFSDLKPFSNYTVVVKETLGSRNGPESKIVVETLPAAPVSKLERVFLKEKNVTSKSITVEWQREVELKESDKFNLTIELKIEDGDKQPIHVNSIAGSPGKHTFSDLKPFSNYTIIVKEKLGSRNGPESKLVVETLQAAPSKPRNLTAVKRKKDSIEIKWNAPLELNGKVDKVMVEYRCTSCPNGELKNRTFPFEQRAINLIDLLPYNNYSIYVKEKTVAYGPYSSINAKTMKDVPKESIDAKSISFKKQDIIEGFNHTKVSVTLQWTPLPKYQWGDVFVEYTISGIASDRYTNESVYNFNLTSYSNYTVKIYAGNSQGKAEANVAVKQLRTKESRPTKPRNVVLIPGEKDNYNDHYINISWAAPEYLNGRPTRYRYSIKLVGDKKRRNVDDFEYGDFGDLAQRSVLTNKKIHPYSKYRIILQERTCTNCWGDRSDEKTVETYPGEPGPVQDVKDKVDSSSVEIRWRRPVDANGKIVHFLVYLKPSEVKQTIAVNDDDRYEYIANFDDLEDETKYSVEIIAVNEGPIIRGIREPGIHGKAYTLDIQTLQSRTWLFILIGCLVVVLIVVLMLAIYLLVSRRRRTYKGVPTNGDMELNTKTKSKPIPLSNFKNICAQQHANSDHGFQQEYEQLRTPVRQFTWEYSSMPCNQVKNRYSNVVAYDHTRVILETIEDDPSSSYINANYIDGYLREKQYIATQGPLPETIIDFWRMIWDEKCPIIVMLTKLVEDNKLKCEQYWPEGKAMQYRDIVVTITSVEEMTDMTVKVFKLHKINNPELGAREVRHFHYTAWPDHGVPAHPTSMLSFIKFVMSYFPKELNDPIVVHCSAGVGRTGTFIAIEGLLRQMENHDTVDVFGTVLRMRMQRNFMVQTESQYIFIYDALLDNVVCGNTEISPENLVSRIKYLNEQDNETNETRFMAEFKRLESGFRIKDKEQFADATHPENKNKNRFLNILPFDKNRIRLTPVAGARQSDYINASIIDGFQQKHAFIATQAPLENTVVDFWRMVCEQNVHVIVMLTKIEEKGQEKSYLYWPQAGMVSYGSLHVEVVNVRNQDDVYIIHDLRVTNRDSGKSWPVTHFLYLGWPEYHGSPDNGTDLIHFIGLVEKTQRSLTNSGPTLVHCSGGVGRTGVFITVFNSVERLKAKSVVDVFQTTRALRLQRSAMVQTIDQYKFCYQCLKDYLDSFDLYTNPEC